ncbi:MAG: ABC transporter permease, partial [bacterium]
MRRYLAHRLLAAVPVTFLVSLMVFGLMNLLPGNPIQAMYGPESGLSPEVLAVVRQTLGLDRGVPERYLIWLGRVVRADLGTSIRTGVPVGQAIGVALPATVALAAASFGLAVLIGLPVGIYAATRSSWWLLGAADSLTLLGMSVPTFVTGPLLILFFAVQFHALPAVGYAPPGMGLAQFFEHLALPAVTQGIHLAAIITLTVRHHVAEELARDYVRTGYAKGLYRGLVLRRHVLRNAMLGIISIGGWVLISQIGGTIVIETLFAWPGIGLLAYRSVQGRD